MKKLFVWALVLMMAMLPMCASAATVVSQGTIENYVYLGTASNTYVTQVEDGFQIYNAAGEPVGPVWPQMGPMLNGMYYQVLNNGKISVVNANGELILPDDYFGFVTTGDDLVAGIVMEPTTEANPDYMSSDGEAMKVLRADIVRDGVLLGSLERGPYLATATIYVSGEYICIQHEDGRCLWFDKNLNRTAETFGDPEEFTVVDGAYIHTATQQQAFVPSCTLTNEQVDQAAVLIGNKVIGLQGNCIAEFPENTVHSLRVAGNYCYVSAGGNVGVWNLQGQNVIPLEYSFIGDPYSQYTEYFASGYQAAINGEGKLVFFNEAGEITVKTDLSVSASKNKGLLQDAPFVMAKNGDVYAVATATRGVLPNLFSDVYVCQNGQKILSVEDRGGWGCIDVDGNLLIPCDYVYYLDISDDGTLAIGMLEDGTAVRYMIDYGN